MAGFSKLEPLVLSNIGPGLDSSKQWGLLGLTPIWKINLVKIVFHYEFPLLAANIKLKGPKVMFLTSFLNFLNPINN